MKKNVQICLWCPIFHFFRQMFENHFPLGGVPWCWLVACICKLAKNEFFLKIVFLGLEFKNWNYIGHFSSKHSACQVWYHVMEKNLKNINKKIQDFVVNNNEAFSFIPLYKCLFPDLFSLVSLFENCLYLFSFNFFVWELICLVWFLC